MNKLRVTADPRTHTFIVEGDFIPGSIPVNIPNDDENRFAFISLFLHKRDIDFCKNYLNCISMDKNLYINQALFIASLSGLMKCFQYSAACQKLDAKDFKAKNQNIASEFDKFKDWRNKHYLHDENSMTETTALLFVAPESHNQALGGLPSVIWNSVQIDYVEDVQKLREVLKAVEQYIAGKIDEIGQKLIDKYKDKTREELLAFGSANIRLCSIAEPNISRNEKQ